MVTPSRPSPQPARSLQPWWCALSVVLGLAALGALGACGDACEDLQVICDRCQDPNHKASCEDFIDRAVYEDHEDHDPDACEQQIDAFDDICPF
ncbi:MAG: hypothetical protein JRI68_14320 [Deltaproteobacteria bacterium]|nr:hypothetical protein [Deltaproteobacteria bacterium]